VAHPDSDREYTQRFNFGSVAHPDSDREYTQRFNFGSVAQLYSASDFGSEGWGLESLRGHSSGDLVNIDRISVFYSR